MGRGGVACPKPEPRKRTKARKDRAEATQKRIVRAACVARDDTCRVARFIVKYGSDGWQLGHHWGWCKGRSEWAHSESSRRFKTRSMSPEARHSTVGTLMLCQFHHKSYDRHDLRLVWLTSFGCDGPLLWHMGDLVYTEGARE